MRSLGSASPVRCVATKLARERCPLVSPGFELDGFVREEEFDPGFFDEDDAAACPFFLGAMVASKSDHQGAVKGQCGLSKPSKLCTSTLRTCAEAMRAGGLLAK